MSRWGRGRSGSVAVPLDSALFRENSNCPSAARSAGTVGKWGITSFTSIRSAPYAYQNNVHKKTIHDQNSPLTVPAVETEQPPPKPKKFFKSRNAELFPPVPQINYAPQASGSHQSPEHSNAKEKKTTKRGRYNRDSSSPDLPRRNSEKGKSRKGLATKAARKDEQSGDSSQPPNKRYLVRNRSRVINYAEDGSNSPIPELTRYESLSHKVPSPKASPLVKCPSPVKVEVASPSTSKDSNEEKKPPPIVLRISKGTSRIVSTDSNEGLTSPSSDRHSSLDTHLDISTGSDNKKSPTVETISSPKQEGLKITIKCSGLNQDAKKEKKEKKDKKEHKSHKRHHKNNDDEPLKTVSSPLPGSDAYDLYKTLASPTSESDKESSNNKQMDYIESQLAQLDSINPVQSPESEKHHKESQPEPKPPESSAGRSRRNRPNINYSENDDEVFALAAKQSSKQTRTVSDLKKEAKKGRRKQDSAVDTAVVATTVTSPDQQEGIDKEPEPHIEKGDLIDILSGSNDNNCKTEGVVPKAKLNKKQKNKQKHLSPEAVVDTPEAVSSQEEQNTVAVEELVQEEPPVDSIPAIEPIESQTQTQSTDSAYNSCPQELSEEESQKNQPEEVFKSPDDHVDTEEQVTEDKPSVKLVITKKKGSIFKSKSLVNDNPSSLPARKRRHLYKHEWAKEKGNETPRSEQSETAEAINPAADDSEELSGDSRYRATDTAMDDPTLDDALKPYASLRGTKEYEVRNVKKTRCARQMQEIGENQEFNDDIEYFLDTLQDNNPMSTRCLSAITLAIKCTAPAFRMHLRAHGTVQKFFSALHDATNDQSLGLCTATVMFVLSQDRLNMDLDRESLELMLNLLESDVSHKNALDDCGLTSAQLAKTQERVRELCAEIKSKGKAQHLDLENITVGHLAMETLLSLTSKRAGEWFKEELRNLGGVDHIVRTIQDCAASLQPPARCWTHAQRDQLRKADRCMRVLENVTQQNEANQQYLVSGSLGAARTLSALLRRCAMDARTHPALQVPLLDAALPAIKVLVNLSHSFGITSSALGAQVVGEQPSLMEICLIMLYNQGNFIPDNKNFDFSVCVLMLLINLVQNNDLNTQRLLSVRIRVDNEHDIISRSMSALDLIVDLFYKRVELARSAEKNTDALLDGEKDDKSDSDNKKQSQDDIEETVAKLLARAGTHMEHTMVGAYLALLLGNMAVAAPTHAQVVRAHLTSYAPMLPTLRKYFDFLTLTASAEAAIVAHVKSTQRIIQFMETSDKENSSEPAASYRSYPCYQTSPSDVPQDMSLSNLNYSMNYSVNSTSSSDRMSSSMEVDGYH